MDWVVTRQRIARLFPGWTLDYIDSLSEEDVLQILAYEDGYAKWKNRRRR